MSTVDSSESEYYLEEQIRSLLLKHILDFPCAEAFKNGVWDGHKADNVLLLFMFSRLHLLVFVLLGDGVERINHHIYYLGEDEPNLLMLKLPRIEINNGNLLAVQIFVDENLEDVFVLLFASSDVRSVNGKGKTRREENGTAKHSHFARVPGIETAAKHITQRFRDITVGKERVRIEETLQPSGDFWRANDNLVGVVSAKTVKVVKSAAKAASAVSTGRTNNGGSSSGKTGVELNKVVNGNSSAVANLSRSSAKIGNENGFKEAVARCDPDE